MVIDSIEVGRFVSTAEDIALLGVGLHAPLLFPFFEGYPGLVGVVGGLGRYLEGHRILHLLGGTSHPRPPHTSIAVSGSW